MRARWLFHVQRVQSAVMAEGDRCLRIQTTANQGRLEAGQNRHYLAAHSYLTAHRLAAEAGLVRGLSKEALLSHRPLCARLSETARCILAAAGEGGCRSSVQRRRGGAGTQALQCSQPVLPGVGADHIGIGAV